MRNLPLRNRRAQAISKLRGTPKSLLIELRQQRQSCRLLETRIDQM